MSKVGKLKKFLEIRVEIQLEMKQKNGFLSSVQSFSWTKFFFFFSDSADCAVCEEALQNLEDIDDDADAVGVRMVKTDDAEFAQFIGLTEFPSIVYYEHGNPHIYDGKL